jgi:NAD(P)-dependent dehydrogenase (short-subunit alcohol dehydrogenase family)
MTEGTPIRVIVLGATSAIAIATARLYAEQQRAHILLAGRQERRLLEVAADLRARGAGVVETAACELADPADAHRQFGEWVSRLGGVDHVLLAYGLLGEQAAAENSQQVAADILAVNFTSQALWALAAAAVLEGQGHGALVVFGSVAGDRGRRSNFVYGAAKAGMTALVEGIAHRFASKGPRAVLVKIGPTITPMTAHLERKGPLWASPEQVARTIHASASRGGPVVYAPRRWRFIMSIIRHLPAVLFNRVNI